MAITKVQQSPLLTGTFSSGAWSSATTTLTGVAAGNLVLALGGWWDAVVNTGGSQHIPTDSNGTFVKAGAAAPNLPASGTPPGWPVAPELCEILNAAAGNHIITPQNIFPGGGDGYFLAVEFSGGAAGTWSRVDDGYAFAGSGTAGAVDTVTVTTAGTAAQVGDLAVSIGTCDGDPSAFGLGSPANGTWNNLLTTSTTTNNIATGAAWRLVTVAGAQSATYNITDNDCEVANAVIAVYRFTPSAGAALAGTPAASVSATAALTTAIKLAGAAAATASATDALSTGIVLAGTAAAAANAAASAAVKMYRPARLIVSIQRASSDGLYWPSYPQGNKPTFAGTPSIATAATAAVTTGIRLAAAPAATVSASGALTTGAGAGAPSAPTGVTGVADTLGGAIDVFFTGPDARSIGPITQYTAKLYNSSGTTYQGITQSANRNSTTGMTSAYIRLDGVSPGTYKVSVSATNSNGTSSEAMSASTVTVAAPSDYYVHSGNSGSTSSPQNSGWGAYGGSGANSYADTTQVFPGQTNSIKVAASGLILPFYKSPWSTDPVNGNFYVKPYTHLVLKLYGASVSQEVNISFRYCSHAFGVTTSGGTNTFTDISQNLVTNGLVNSAGSIQVKGGKAMNAGAGCSNTANTVTDTNGGGFNWTAGGGQGWIASYGDQDFAVGRTNSQPVVGGIASYCKRQRDPTTGAIVNSLTTPQPNLWNEFEIPLSVMNVYSGLAGNYQEHFYPGAIQELRVQNLNSSPIYITDFGFTVA